MSYILDSTPKQDGFRVPAEWEPQDQTWLIWPEHPNNWHSGAKPAQRTWVELCKLITQFQRVTVIASGRQYKTARAMLPREVRVVEMSIDDSWARDSGPSFVVNDATGEVRAVDWRYNAYGGLEEGHYWPWDKTALIAEKIGEIERLDYYKAPIICEGGSIHTDGEGTVLTTESVLLNPNRNPGMTKEGMTDVLYEYMGAEKVIWLPSGLSQDCTGGHIDDLACWVRPGEVLMQWTEDPENADYENLHTCHEILAKTTDARGRRLKVHKMVQPKNPIKVTREETMNYDLADYNLPIEEAYEQCGSYINFLIGNGVVIVPSYDDPNDSVAVQALQELFPDRTVIPLANAREIAIGGGIIHCITHEQPSAPALG